MMPKMDGWEVCRDKKMDKTPIIMLTGKSDNYDKLKALDLWNG
jgi:DNA-binding response OmpR family regulator